MHRAAAEEIKLDAHEVAGAGGAVARRLENGTLYCWYRGDQPVSMAATVTTSFRGRCGRINMVFTPPEFRSRGYATACVGALSRQLLASGWHQCLIFTDRNNPVTNHIYPKLGYRVIENFSNFRFLEV